GGAGGDGHPAHGVALEVEVCRVGGGGDGHLGGGGAAAGGGVEGEARRGRRGEGHGPRRPADGVGEGVLRLHGDDARADAGRRRQRRGGEGEQRGRAGGDGLALARVGEPRRRRGQRHPLRLGPLEIEGGGAAPRGQGGLGDGRRAGGVRVVGE